MRIIKPEKMKEAQRSKTPLAIFYTADWCGHCGEPKRIFQQMQPDSSAEFVIGDLTEEADYVWKQYGIDIIPTIVVYREGQEIYRANGVIGEGLTRKNIENLVQRFPKK